MTHTAASALLVSLKVAGAATLAALPLGVVLALLLARADFRGKSLVETACTLPLVLPPTAIGYLLLRLFARGGPLDTSQLGAAFDILFTWKAAALASAVMSLPLVVRTARVAFEEVDPRLEGMARTLGFGRFRVLMRVTLPLARRGLFAAAVLGFSRALGEFGATIVVAGNIPGRTQTLSLAIFQEMELAHDATAMRLVGITAAIAFAAVWTAEWLRRR